MPSKKRRVLNNETSELAQFRRVKMAAARGSLNAQHDLAAFYATDDTLGVKDEAEAVKWYTRAAESGHGQSQYDLGFMLLLGEGAETDVAGGLRWMRKAVANGSSDAARLLSDIYEKGWFEVEVSPSKAAYWRRRARLVAEAESNNGMQRTRKSASFSSSKLKARR